ncbi:MAG: DciA family protein [Marmoricola sp.]
MTEPTEPREPAPPEPRDPLDLARAIARGLAGKTPARRRRSSSDRRSRSEDPTFSGPRDDPRDPQPLDKAIESLIAEGGWSEELRVHGVFARWGAIVGSEIAEHATPMSLADGRLEVRADTTAWATQLRLLAPELLKRMNQVLGDGTVLIIDVKGPNAPSWSKGRFRVKGRGPRDTYG